MVAFRSVKTRLIAATLASCALVFLLVLHRDNRMSRDLLARMVEQEARTVAQAAARELEAVLRAAEKIPRDLATFLVHGSCDDASVRAVLRGVVEAHPEVYGSAVAWDPRTRAGAPYCHRGAGGIRVTDLADPAYDYAGRDWFLRTRDTREASWTEPYFDEGGGDVLMATYAVPVLRRADGAEEFVGVATVDLSLGWLRERVASIQVGERGFAALLSREGRVMNHPDAGVVMRRTVFELAAERGDARLGEAGRRMVAGEAGLLRGVLLPDGREGWVAFEPVRATGWSLAVLFARDDLAARLDALRRDHLLLGLAGLVLLAAVVVLVAGTITRPLRALASAVPDLARHDLQAAIPAQDRADEVGLLARALAAMQGEIRRYVQEVAALAAAEERSRSELRIARDIQAAMLPPADGGLPAGLDAELGARLIPARTVGGDLLDCLLLDDDRLAFLVGDVSGKGVPAALFMARAATLLRTELRGTREPAAALARVNRELAPGNEACMFATLFVGVLDLASGRITFANAGHEPPILLPADGAPRLLDAPRATALGLVEDLEVPTEERLLRPGEALLLYTDGITEALDAQGTAFGLARLVASAARHPDLPPAELAAAILRETEAFEGGAEPFDDKALLAIRYTAPPQRAEHGKHWRLHSDVRQIPMVLGDLRRHLAARAAAPEAIHDAVLALEEVLANIVVHGYGRGAPGTIEVRCAVHAGQIALEIRDHAPAYDPTAAPEPDLTAPLAERPVGGLGVLLIRRLMDKVSYERREDTNILSLLRKAT